MSQVPFASSWPSGLARQWSTDVGSGQSSPVVKGDVVFVFSREGESEVVRALTLESGQVLWRQEYPAPYEGYPGAAAYGIGPRSTPVVHDGRVFTLGISGILTAFDAGSGRRLWQNAFPGRFAAPAPPYGASMSPLVVGGILIVHAGGHAGGALIGFDPATGREQWALPGEGPSYSSPILARFMGQDQVVLQVHKKLLGVDPASGRQLWSLPFVTPCDQNIVTPLQAGSILVVSSLGQGTLGVKVTKSGEAWVPEVVWRTQDVSMYMSSPVLVGGRVFGLSHKKRGQYFTLDPATGSVDWKGDPGQGEHAAFVVAGESVLSLQGDGLLFVFRHTAPAVTQVRRYQVAENQTFSHPAPTARGILVRDGNAVALHRPAGAVAF